MELRICSCTYCLSRPTRRLVLATTALTFSHPLPTTLPSIRICLCSTSPETRGYSSYSRKRFENTRQGPLWTSCWWWTSILRWTKMHLPTLRLSEGFRNNDLRCGLSPYDEFLINAFTTISSSSNKDKYVSVLVTGGTRTLLILWMPTSAKEEIKEHFNVEKLDGRTSRASWWCPSIFVVVGLGCKKWPRWGPSLINFGRLFRSSWSKLQGYQREQAGVWCTTPMWWRTMIPPKNASHHQRR